MTNSTRGLGAAVIAASLGLAAPATAGGDLYGPLYGPEPYGAYVPEISWTGPYIGGNIGYAWGDGELSDPTVMGIPFSGSRSRDYDGTVGGGQIGFNLETGSAAILGVEADIQTADIAHFESIEGVASVDGNLDWFSTVRGRVGVRKGLWMPYVTGGAAFGKNKLRIDVPGVGITARDSQSHSGWTVGGGLEGREGSVSGRIEYLYVDLGKETYSATATVAGFGPVSGSVKGKVDLHILRAGVNYHF